jgi:hypothetical protein
MGILEIPILDKPFKSVLLSGAGGGFDIYSGLPVYFYLRERGINVYLANLSLIELKDAKLIRIVCEGCYIISADTRGLDYYFPERTLSRWFRHRGEEVPIYCIKSAGVAPVIEAYRMLCKELGIDAVILTDAGIDSLMRGDEVQLGTPVEDITSIAAVSCLNIPTKILSCVGFGVDLPDGVCHYHALEAISELMNVGGFHGAFTLTRNSPYVLHYMEAMQFAKREMRCPDSISQSSILASIEGYIGSFPNKRTHGTQQTWVSPLMSICWLFDLNNVAKRILYLESILNTETIPEVQQRIEEFHSTAKLRGRKQIPL